MSVEKFTPLDDLYQDIVRALHTVHDPEIPVNIYELGLIYKLDVYVDGDVEVEMTLTSPGCPVAGEIVRQTKEAVQSVPGVKQVAVELVWEPSWDKSMMSERAKIELDMF